MKKWYVVNTYSGHENKVRTTMERRIESLGLGRNFGEISIPTESVIEIKNGKIAGMLKDVAYQSNTQEFWNSCAQVCDARDYRLNGAFNDGKGQPSQSNAVSHGSATTRFNGVNVINTGRTI